MNFESIQKVIAEKILQLTTSNEILYTTNLDKHALWNVYLSSFPEGTNPMFRERTEHDCQCCKNFIRDIGHVVAINDDLKLESVWDVENVNGYNEMDNGYKVVCKALSEYVKKHSINSIFKYEQNIVGKETTYINNETWHHFYGNIDEKHVSKNTDMFSSGQLLTDHGVMIRGFNEISFHAIEIAIELLEQISIPRGEEFKKSVINYYNFRKDSIDIPISDVNHYIWKNITNKLLLIKNTVIGTLLCDITDGINLEVAVDKFGQKMDGYKRPTSLVTGKMIDNAKKTIEEIGRTESLERRHASIEDITINNVLFADRSAQKEMDAFDQLKSKIPSKKSVKNFDKVEEVHIEKFISDILPTVEEIELFVNNDLSNNFMTLTAPVNTNAPLLMKWNNNFAWDYINNRADSSMKDLVKKHGGNINGDHRFSIRWNENNDSRDDLDAHCVEPNGFRIFYENAKKLHPSSGRLDVDIIDPGNEPAVENIVYADKRKMPIGDYKFSVLNYHRKGGVGGFSAEIEFNGKIYEYEYPKSLMDKERIHIATTTWDGKKFSIKHHLKPISEKSETIWNIDTNNFHKVRVVMYSPNYWDTNEVGNKHYFFILDDCKNPDKVRGFYNEFLMDELTPHRKVFEILGNSMAIEYSDEQLSGIGISSTKKQTIVCRIKGATQRILKINF